ncbi:MAG: hypothetical protein Q8K78_14720 [Planctomycetaceae bacterium]|nr:hypothetical protein [Planctomycetaceae bacterium]
MSHSEMVATLQFCLGVIRARLADRQYHDQRWFWELRENVALFALRSQLTEFADLDVAPLSLETQQSLLKSHPLLAPYDPPRADPPSGDRRALQSAMRQKIASTFLAAPPLPKPGSSAHGV